MKLNVRFKVKKKSTQMEAFRSPITQPALTPS